MKTEGYQVAFPTTYEHPSGLTKREYFAAQALAGLFAYPGSEWSMSEVAKVAVTQAEELIKALNDE